MYNNNQTIGILGSGDVGRVLGSAFAAEGHPVMLGTRNTAKEEVVQWRNEHAGAQTGTFAETAAFGEILILAVEGGVALDMIGQAGAGNFTGKTVIDATNPIAKEAPDNGVLKFFTGANGSLLEQIQHRLPEANVVKAFNSAGNLVFYKPDFAGVKPTMFICGNNDAAKETVTRILDAFGWETADMGAAAAARAIEPLAMLWCIPGFLHNQWTHAFKLLKK